MEQIQGQAAGSNQADCPKPEDKPEFIVVDEDLTPLIGAQAAQHMGLITVHNENFVQATPPRRHERVVQTLAADELFVRKFSDVFESKLGTFAGEVHLEIEPDAKPTIAPPRRIPSALKDKFKEELSRLVEIQL